MSAQPVNLYAPENVVPFLRSIASESIAGKQYARAADLIEQQATAHDELLLAQSHLRGLVFHWNEFGPADGYDELMHHAHSWLQKHDATAGGYAPEPSAPSNPFGKRTALLEVAGAGSTPKVEILFKSMDDMTAAADFIRSGRVFALLQDVARYENGRVVMLAEIKRLKQEVVHVRADRLVQVARRETELAELRHDLQKALANHSADLSSAIEPDGWIRYMRHAAGGPEPEEKIFYDFASRSEPHEGEGWAPLYSRPAVEPPAALCVEKSFEGTRCPFTKRPYFMHIDHPELGRVPTYGGPFDSYTIPTPDDDGERTLRVERYDHDAGDWIEGGEPLRLHVVTDQEFSRLCSALPPPVSHSGEVERLCHFLRRVRDVCECNGDGQAVGLCDVALLPYSTATKKAARSPLADAVEAARGAPPAAPVRFSDEPPDFGAWRCTHGSDHAGAIAVALCGCERPGAQA